MSIISGRSKLVLLTKYVFVILFEKVLTVRAEKITIQHFLSMSKFAPNFTYLEVSTNALILEEVLDSRSSMIKCAQVRSI